MGNLRPIPIIPIEVIEDPGLNFKTCKGTGGSCAGILDGWTQGPLTSLLAVSNQWVGAGMTAAGMSDNGWLSCGPSRDIIPAFFVKGSLFNYPWMAVESRMLTGGF